MVAPFHLCACGHCAPAPVPQACPDPTHDPHLLCGGCGGCGACCDYLPPPEPGAGGAHLERLDLLWSRFLEEIHRRREAGVPAGPRDQCRARRLEAALIAHFNALAQPEDLAGSWYVRNLYKPWGCADLCSDLIEAVAAGFLCWVGVAHCVLEERRFVDDPWVVRQGDPWPWYR